MERDRQRERLEDNIKHAHGEESLVRFRAYEALRKRANGEPMSDADRKLAEKASQKRRER